VSPLSRPIPIAKICEILPDGLARWLLTFPAVPRGVVVGEMHELVDEVWLAHVRGEAAQLPVGRVGNKKNHTKKNKKNLKKTLKTFFWFFGVFF
jgi:hypothetical protein